MEFLDLNDQPLWINLTLFAVAACMVWFAGVRVTSYADTIARETGIGHIAAGLLLLAGVTSLPEVAVALFSAAAHNPALTINNLLGEIAMQKAILAGADAIIGKEALTVVVASPAVLLQGALCILTLTVAAAAIAVGDVPLLHAGAWSWAILIIYGFSIWIISNSQGRHPWIAQGGVEPPVATVSGVQGGRSPLKPVLAWTAVASAVILVAGFLLSRTGDAIAAQTGLGQNFVGAALLALSTSLPEASTVVSAMRLRQYEMAVSDILGTNLFNVALVFLVDAVYPGAPVFNEVGNFSLIAVLLGILLTAIYLIGLIERRNRTIARMGIDSLAVIVMYLGGLYILYQLR